MFGLWCVDVTVWPVSSDTLEIKEPALLIEFENVPVARLGEVVPRLNTVLRNIVRNGEEKFDLERITNFIQREVRSCS